MEKVRIGLLGCGLVSDLYLPVFRHIPEVELAAVADIDSNAAGEVARRYGVSKIFESAGDMSADGDIDAVIVATPPQFHAKNIERLARSGKHILCEKPMASTVGDCRRIIDVCEKYEVKLQLAHMKRFLRGNQKVKAIIDSGMLGKVFMVECQWDVAVPHVVGTYREKEAAGGGVLQDHGPHAFDLVRWWTGSNIEDVSATVRIIHPDRVNEDTAVVIAGHQNGVTGIYHMSRIFFGREYNHDFYRVYGTEGTLDVRNEHHFPTMSLESPEIVYYGPGGIVRNLDVLHGWSLDDQVMQNSAFYSEVKAFAECILKDTEPRVTGEDGLHSMECVAASYQSCLSGRKVNLPFKGSEDYAALFSELKKREIESLGTEYAIGTEAKTGFEVSDPVMSYRPPRTGGKWDPVENGMTDVADSSGLSRKLKFKK